MGYFSPHNYSRSVAALAFLPRGCSELKTSRPPGVLTLKTLRPPGVEVRELDFQTGGENRGGRYNACGTIVGLPSADLDV